MGLFAVGVEPQLGRPVLTNSWRRGLPQGWRAADRAVGRGLPAGVEVSEKGVSRGRSPPVYEARRGDQR